MRILSISRRTDVPAFYTDWLMNRLRAGFVRWPHLYGGEPMTASLAPDEVAAIVFWSKDYRPLLPRLPELDAAGYPLLFQFTITGLPRCVEPGVPDWRESVEAARALAARYTPDAVLWRYDPIFLSSLTPPDYHRARFRELCQAMEGTTRRCTVSFPMLYAKVRANLEYWEKATGERPQPLSRPECRSLLEEMAEIARQHGIALAACCSEEVRGERVEAAHCIDRDLLRQLYPGRLGHAALRPTRKGCGCADAVDVGAYGTCAHGCIYCYANVDPAVARAARAAHDPAGDMLTGASGAPAPAAAPSPQLTLEW